MSGLIACTEAQRCNTQAADNSADTCAIIAAGGIGERFGDKRGKQYVELCGLPIASWAVMAFDQAPSVGHIVIVCPEGRVEQTRETIVAPLSLSTPVTYTTAGETRQGSVMNGLLAMPEFFSLVAIHDGARPLVTVDAIERCIACVRTCADVDGAICAARVTDTLKLVEDGDIVATPDRSYYWSALTPQVFKVGSIMAAHRAAVREGYVGTDDASLVEHAGGRVRCVESPRDNIKVTLPEDLAVAEATMRQRLGAEGLGL